MPYWGNKPEDSDYAFNAIGAYVFLIKERMFKDIETVIDKSYPEQSIVASLKCLRLLAEEFPKCVRVTFRRKHFEESKAMFERWYEVAKSKLPAERSGAILAEARAEFDLFEERVLRRSAP